MACRPWVKASMLPRPWHVGLTSDIGRTVPAQPTQRDGPARYGLSLCDAVGARGLRHACVTASRPRWARCRQVSEQNLESDRCGRYALPHCAHQLTARQHRRRPLRMKPRPDRVSSVETIPCEVLLAAHGRPFEPAQASHRHDVGTRRHEGRGLLGGGPVGFEQQPRRQNAREVRDQGVHERARVGRVGDDRVGVAIRCRAPRRPGRSRCRRHRRSAARTIPDGAPARRHRSTARRTCAHRADAGSAAAPPRTASDRSRAESARSWNACPCHCSAWSSPASGRRGIRLGSPSGKVGKAGKHPPFAAFPTFPECLWGMKLRVHVPAPGISACSGNRPLPQPSSPHQ